MTYLQHEGQYRELVRKYLSQDATTEDFVGAFFAQWRSDRDVQWEQVRARVAICPEEAQLCDALDRIFTACDCFCSPPGGPGAIDSVQLMAEVRDIAGVRWPGTIA